MSDSASAQQKAAEAAPVGDAHPFAGMDAALSGLRLARYRLRFRLAQSQKGAAGAFSPRNYLGAAWRGAFGHALRETACITGLSDCGGCVLLDSCSYPRLFESRTPPAAKKLTRYPRTPAPYVLEPFATAFDEDEETLSLGVVLFGRANADFPLIAQALKRAGRRGIGTPAAALELVDVQAEGAGEDGVHWRSAAASSGCVPGMRLAAPAAPEAVRVRLVSPLRIRRNERYARPAEFDFRAFAANLLRRLSLLTYFYGNAPLETNFAALLKRAAQVPVARSDLHWRAWSRRSSRQQSRIEMGGLTGAFEIDSVELRAFWPSLWLGQWTHIGKGCTMGLGRYVLESAAGGAANRWQGPARL